MSTSKKSVYLKFASKICQFTCLKSGYLQNLHFIFITKTLFFHNVLIFWSRPMIALSRSKNAGMLLSKKIFVNCGPFFLFRVVQTCSTQINTNKKLIETKCISKHTPLLPTQVISKFESKCTEPIPYWDPSTDWTFNSAYSSFNFILKINHKRL